jgi:hypothetical protein
MIKLFFKLMSFLARTFVVETALVYGWSPSTFCAGMEPSMRGWVLHTPWRKKMLKCLQPDKSIFIFDDDRIRS